MADISIWENTTLSKTYDVNTLFMDEEGDNLWYQIVESSGHDWPEFFTVTNSSISIAATHGDFANVQAELQATDTLGSMVAYQFQIKVKDNQAPVFQSTTIYASEFVKKSISYDFDAKVSDAENDEL